MDIRETEFLPKLKHMLRLSPLRDNAGWEAAPQLHPCPEIVLEERPRLTPAQFALRLIADRRDRARAFDEPFLFSDPAWDMLLDLFVAHETSRRVTISSLSIAASAPATTALRWIRMMETAGHFARCEDPVDENLSVISLTDQGHARMLGAIEDMARNWSVQLTDAPVAGLAVDRA